jgi:hypothetical protein
VWEMAGYIVCFSWENRQYIQNIEKYEIGLANPINK